MAEPGSTQNDYTGAQHGSTDHAGIVRGKKPLVQATLVMRVCGAKRNSKNQTMQGIPSFILSMNYVIHVLAFVHDCSDASGSC